MKVYQTRDKEKNFQSLNCQTPKNHSISVQYTSTRLVERMPIMKSRKVARCKGMPREASTNPLLEEVIVTKARAIM